MPTVIGRSYISLPLLVAPHVIYTAGIAYGLCTFGVLSYFNAYYAERISRWKRDCVVSGHGSGHSSFFRWVSKPLRAFVNFVLAMTAIMYVANDTHGTLFSMSERHCQFIVGLCFTLPIVLFGHKPSLAILANVLFIFGLILQSFNSLATVYHYRESWSSYVAVRQLQELPTDSFVNDYPAFDNLKEWYESVEHKIKKLLDKSVITHERSTTEDSATTTTFPISSKANLRATSFTTSFAVAFDPAIRTHTTEKQDLSSHSSVEFTTAVQPSTSHTTTTTPMTTTTTKANLAEKTMPERKASTDSISDLTTQPSQVLPHSDERLVNQSSLEKYWYQLREFYQRRVEDVEDWWDDFREHPKQYLTCLSVLLAMFCSFTYDLLFPPLPQNLPRHQRASTTLSQVQTKRTSWLITIVSAIYIISRTLQLKNMSSADHFVFARTAKVATVLLDFGLLMIIPQQLMGLDRIIVTLANPSRKRGGRRRQPSLCESLIVNDENMESAAPPNRSENSRLSNLDVFPCQRCKSLKYTISSLSKIILILFGLLLMTQSSWGVEQWLSLLGSTFSAWLLLLLPQSLPTTRSLKCVFITDLSSIAIICVACHMLMRTWLDGTL